MNIVCAGFGGQGVLTAGLIMGKTAMDHGKEVSWIPAYGSEMRGGNASCHLKISDKYIASPFIRKGDIDLLLVMNQNAFDLFAPQVKSTGCIVYNSSLIEPNLVSEASFYAVAATDIATELENTRGGNLTMLGAVAKTQAVFEEKSLYEGMQAFFEEKGYKPLIKNDDCFKAGLEQCQLVEI